jgi:alkylation response protein AidB-like acyl-CoA dehydrogenase
MSREQYADDPPTAGEAPSLAALARRVAEAAGRRASSLDRDGAFPADDIADLHACGLLAAPFPARFGGSDMAVGHPHVLRRVLTTVGRGSLALGRLYEGHVNAVGLVARYGGEQQLRLLKDEAEAGRPSGVWMAGEPLRLERQSDGRFVLRGRKILCSGAGHFRRPLVAADFEGGSVMLIPSVDQTRADASGWTAQGMRATATGTVDFDGIVVAPREIVGRPGDYLRPPYFRGGAWRVIAVQLGGLEAVLDHYKEQLATSPHRDHPVQLARFGEALIAAETARLWVRQAGAVAESPPDDPEAIDAYVDLARNAFERATLEVIAAAEKAVGLKALMRPNPLERVIRDLATYLRQPALDASLLAAAAFDLGRPR